ncbi:hypothetical protein D3C78_931510 [compost metagenome]
MHHVYRLRSMILQADLLARLELTLLHQLLEVLAPQSSLALVGSLQFHEVAGVLAWVVLVGRCAVLQQFAADDRRQGWGFRHQPERFSLAGLDLLCLTGNGRLLDGWSIWPYRPDAMLSRLQLDHIAVG